MSAANSTLREDYFSHEQSLADLDVHSKVIARIESERMKADMTTQETNTLIYESEQFNIPDLWHTASLSRRKVLELREKVFGTGGRRLPPGVKGAHGRFNRLQWALDGQETLVDWMGRTESEVKEEGLIGDVSVETPAEEEEELVKHASIKPMWLLRFFNSWRVRWGWGNEKTTQEREMGMTETPKGTPELESPASERDLTAGMNPRSGTSTTPS